MKKRIIWSNMYIDAEAWREDLIEYRKENGYEDPDDVDLEDAYAFARESLENQLWDEQYNLNIETEGDILVIADLGLWNGRKQGYRIICGNVKNIFDMSEDYNEWYSDGYNIKSTAIHHDGTNYYEYRVIRKDRNIEKLLEAIYNGEELTRKKLNYYTKSLHPYVARVYGW